MMADIDELLGASFGFLSNPTKANKTEHLPAHTPRRPSPLGDGVRPLDDSTFLHLCMEGGDPAIQVQDVTQCRVCNLLSSIIWNVAHGDAGLACGDGVDA